jgi:hypothetical protein
MVSGSLMNLAAVMVSVEEPNSKQKQNSKTRRTDKLVFRTSPIGSTLLVCENADFGCQDAGALLSHCFSSSYFFFDRYFYQELDVLTFYHSKIPF